MVVDLVAVHGLKKSWSWEVGFVVLLTQLLVLVLDGEGERRGGLETLSFRYRVGDMRAAEYIMSRISRGRSRNEIVICSISVL
jgi:hypothetical protein